LGDRELVSSIEGLWWGGDSGGRSGFREEFNFRNQGIGALIRFSGLLGLFIRRSSNCNHGRTHTDPGLRFKGKKKGEVDSIEAEGREVGFAGCFVMGGGRRGERGILTEKKIDDKLLTNFRCTQGG